MWEILLSPGSFSFQYRTCQHLQEDHFSSTVNLKPCLSAENPAKPWSNSLLLIMLTSLASPIRYKNISPAKKMRSIKRLLSFQFIKMKHSRLIRSLSICHQEQSSFSPSRPSLSITHVQTTPIPSETTPTPLSPINAQSVCYPPQTFADQPKPVADHPQSIADQPLPLLDRPLGELTSMQFSEIMENWMKNKFKPP